jgi:hypothetical protein
MLTYMLFFVCCLLLVGKSAGFGILPLPTIPSTDILSNDPPMIIDDKQFILFVDNGEYQCGVEQVAVLAQKVWCRVKQQTTWSAIPGDYKALTHMFLGEKLNLCVWDGQRQVLCLRETNHKFRNIGFMAFSGFINFQLEMDSPSELLAVVQYPEFDLPFHFTSTFESPFQMAWFMSIPTWYEVAACNGKYCCVAERNRIWCRSRRAYPSSTWYQVLTGWEELDNLKISRITLVPGNLHTKKLKVLGTVAGVQWIGKSPDFLVQRRLKGGFIGGLAHRNSFDNSTVINAAIDDVVL